MLEREGRRDGRCEREPEALDAASGDEPCSMESGALALEHPGDIEQARRATERPPREVDLVRAGKTVPGESEEDSEAE
jgi:hypothetical protein